LTIQRFPVADRQQWLDLRKNDVTGSEVGALFDVHRYLTPAKLYTLKSGGMVEEQKADAVISRGVKLESFVASEVAAKHPELSIAKGVNYYRDTKNRIGGTPDYIFFDKESDSIGKGVLEIKTVGRSDFIRIWRGGDPEGEIIPEPWQLLQLMTYVYLTDAKFGKFAVLPVGEWEPMEVHVVDVPRNNDVIDQIIVRTRRFWDDINEGIEPKFNFEKDAEVIKAMYANVRPGSTVDYRGDEEFRDTVALYNQFSEQEKQYKERKEVMAAKIRVQMGEYEVALADGWDVSLKEQHRKEFISKATSFRVLRAKQHGAKQRQIEGIE
jgi:predicted phage-related endonuclease